MLSLLASFFFLAAQTIDGDMSRQDQKETGLYKLTDKQKLALQKWIDNNYAKKDLPLAAKTTKSAPVLEDNYNNGSLIRLSDSSTWEIDPADTPITQGWITPVEIIVSPSNDPHYPYTLTNSLTQSKVRAKKATNTPRPSNK